MSIKGYQHGGNFLQKKKKIRCLKRPLHTCCCRVETVESNVVMVAMKSTGGFSLVGSCKITFDALSTIVPFVVEMDAGGVDDGGVEVVLPATTEAVQTDVNPITTSNNKSNAF